MIKIVSILLFSSIYLFGASFWTLTGLEKANVYVKNQVPDLKQSTLKSIKKKMLLMLKKEGIKTNQQDSPTLMIALFDIKDNGKHYVYTRLALAEEVQTFRKNKDDTFALTYLNYDFIDTENNELDSDVLESVDFLLLEFAEQYKDDKDD